MEKKKVKRPKMDRLLVATNQPHELDTIIAKFKKEGIAIHAADILLAVKKVGHGRKAVYKHLREIKSGCQ